ncbi:hypothetical protein [Micromonospora sp. L5]|uniref:hypothetical protein n=1 Tax=Micromonospora sp. (strain L5) TaxID=648999 RepID=UPI0001C47667|nr:hypothetical protein [Micromonospora sp. L5]
MKAEQNSWLVRIAIVLLGAALVALVIFTLLRGGTTTIVSTNPDGKTTTTTQSNVLALALVTGLIALLSAIITTTLGHWYTNTVEREKRVSELRKEHAARVRDQISAVARDIAAMLEDVRPLHKAISEGADLEAAELSDLGASAVRKFHNSAMPHIEVLDDDSLRRAANQVFELRGIWFTGNREALVNGTRPPSGDKALKAVETFFARARTVINEAEVGS